MGSRRKAQHDRKTRSPDKKVRGPIRLRHPGGNADKADMKRPSPTLERIIAGTTLTVLFLAGVALGYWSLQRGLGFLFDFGGERLDPIIGGSQYM